MWHLADAKSATNILDQMCHLCFLAASTNLGLLETKTEFGSVQSSFWVIFLSFVWKAITKHFDLNGSILIEHILHIKKYNLKFCLKFVTGKD